MEEEQLCKKHMTEKFWHECENCEDGYSHHDCGEDCCCCLYPENNVICDICEGKRGWYMCSVCAEEAGFHDYV